MPYSTTPRSTLIVPHSTNPLAELLERERIIGRITELFLATDRRDWACVERCFADEVRFDMSSVGAGAPTIVSGVAIAEGWRDGLAAIEQIHHQAGNFTVKIVAEQAEASCYGIAYHFKRRRTGGQTRVFVGSYDFELEKWSDGWRITAMRFTCKFIDGNATLEAPE